MGVREVRRETSGSAAREGDRVDRAGAPGFGAAPIGDDRTVRRDAGTPAIAGQQFRIAASDRYEVNSASGAVRAENDVTIIRRECRLVVVVATGRQTTGRVAIRRWSYPQSETTRPAAVGSEGDPVAIFRNGRVAGEAGVAREATENRGHYRGGAEVENSEDGPGDASAQAANYRGTAPTAVR